MTSAKSSAPKAQPLKSKALKSDTLKSEVLKEAPKSQATKAKALKEAASQDFADQQARCLADLEATLKCIEGRWKLVILSRLCNGAVLRFSELERAIPDVSQKMLIQQLRDLEQDGIVARIVHQQIPPKVEYTMTEIGTALGPVFQALLDWATLRKEGRAAVRKRQVIAANRARSQRKRTGKTLR